MLPQSMSSLFTNYLEHVAAESNWFSRNSTKNLENGLEEVGQRSSLSVILSKRDSNTPSTMLQVSNVFRQQYF